jgi:hypothetical protein
MKAAPACILVLAAATNLHSQPAQDPFVGKWRCSHKVMVEIRADGTAEHTGKVAGVWKVVPTQTAERKYQITWKDGAIVDSVTLERGGKKYSAKNSDGFKYTADRIGE